MSNDAPSGPPSRPRSTPIPAPDGGQGPLLPPPTAAQFLRGQSGLPWTPQPGPDVNRVFQGASVGFGSTGDVPSAGGPGSGGSSGVRTVVVLIMLIAVGVGVGAAVYFGTRSGDAAPAPTIQPLPSLGVPSTELKLATTLPAPPPTPVPDGEPTLATALPAGVTSLYADGAARAVADQLELAISGDPTELTVVYLFPDYAIATAEDPQNPGRLIGASWRDGAVGDVDITSTGSDGGGGDLSAQRFTEGDVDWEAIAALVPQATGLLHIPDGQVSYVAVQRIGVGNPPPIVIDVFVEGPSGRGYVEASAAGDIQSVNNG